MPVIDFHNHYYPPNYMKALQSGQSSVRVTVDSDGNPNLHYPGDYNVAVRGHRDLAYREEVLDQHGVTMQCVTLTTPGTHVETPETAVRLASMVNDEFKEAMETRGKHFTALATLPLNDPKASLKEFQRATGQLGLRGAMLFSNINGVALSDERFWPIYEAANDIGAVMYIHPEHPVNVSQMEEFWLMPLVGFLYDTTLAAASLTFNGVPERYPRIKWALCHLGGTIPYLVERLDRGFHTHTRAQQRFARPRAKVAFRTGAQVVLMGVSNHGALDRVPRIDVEIPRRTIQTVGIELQKVVHELGQAFPPVQSPCAQD